MLKFWTIFFILLFNLFEIREYNEVMIEKNENLIK